MSSHTQPTPEQLAPLVKQNQQYWGALTKAMTVGVISVVVLLSLMATFLVKH